MTMENLGKALKIILSRPKTLLPFLISFILFLLIFLIFGKESLDDNILKKIFFHLDFKEAISLVEKIIQIEGFVVIVFFPVIFTLVNVLLTELTSLVFFNIFIKNKIVKIPIKSNFKEIEIIGERFKREYDKTISGLKIQIYLTLILEMIILYVYIYNDSYIMLLLLVGMIFIANIASVFYAREIIVQNAFYRHVALNEKKFSGLMQVLIEKT